MLQIMIKARNNLKEIILMNNNEKLDLINSIEVIDFEASNDAMEFVLVEDTKRNRGILNKLGMTDIKIDGLGWEDDGCLDIMEIGFKYANWWHEGSGFCNI